MIRKLSAGFPRRPSMAAGQLQEGRLSAAHGQLPEIKVAAPCEGQSAGKSSEPEAAVGMGTGPSRVKKALFPETTSRLPLPRAHSSRQRSADRELAPRSVGRSGSTARKKRRSRSLEGHSLFTTPGSSYRATPRESHRSFLFHGQSVVKGPAKDTRPLSDKQFQNQALGKVRRYIAKMHTSADYLPMNITNQITLKTFIELMDFLLSKLFPGIKLTQSNFAEEIPLYMKKVGYPGVVNRSSLIAANAPHTWPHILGMLHYLVCLLDFDVDCTYIVADDDPLLDGTTMEAFVQDIREAYTRYQLDGIVLSELPNFQRERSKKFKNHLAELERLKAEIAEMAAQLDTSENQADIEKEKALQKEENDLAMEERSLTEQIHTIQERMCTRKRRIAELEAEMNQEAMILKSGKEAVAALQEMVKSQSMSKADRENILQDSAKLRDTYNSLEKCNEEVQKDIYMNNLQKAQLGRQMRDAILKYNTKLLVNTGERSLAEFEIKIDNVPEEEWPQYFSAILKKLEEYHTTLRKRLREHEEKKSKAEESLQKLDEELAILSSQLKHKEEEYRALKTAQKEKEDVLRREEKQLQKQIADQKQRDELASLKGKELDTQEQAMVEKMKLWDKDLHFINTTGAEYLENRKKYYHELVAAREDKENKMLEDIQRKVEEYRQRLEQEYQ